MHHFLLQICSYLESDWSEEDGHHDSDSSVYCQANHRFKNNCKTLKKKNFFKKKISIVTVEQFYSVQLIHWDLNCIHST